jgi:hypothetical protein
MLKLSLPCTMLLLPLSPVHWPTPPPSVAVLPVVLPELQADTIPKSRVAVAIIRAAMVDPECLIFAALASVANPRAVDECRGERTS